MKKINLVMSYALFSSFICLSCKATISARSTVVSSPSASPAVTQSSKTSAKGSTSSSGSTGTVPATISNISSSLSAGTYGTGQVVDIEITFSKAVTVRGTPQLSLNTAPAEVASYSSGSGTSTLTFNYTVVLGDLASPLNYASAASLSLNHGSINDAAGNAATLTLPATSSGNALAGNKLLTIYGAPSGTVAILNLHNKQSVETGFLVGTATADVAAVGCQFDSGAILTAVGTTNWKCALPNGVNTWHLGSSHTVAVGILYSSALWSTTTISVTKGHNKDIDGDGYPDLVVGAPYYSTYDGGVYIYYGSSSGISSPAIAGNPTIAGKTASGERFGSSVSLDDVDGDGYADLVVGAYTYNNGTANDGGVYIFYGGSGGISSSTAAAPIIAGEAASGERFGSSVALGDIKGDGYADLVVGAPFYNSASRDGGVYIYYGSSTRTSNTTAGEPTIAGQPGSGGYFGSSIALGDINGDGYSDLVVGAVNYANYDGGVYIYNGSSSGISISTAGAATIVGRSGDMDGFGSSLALGDINGDGYADLVVGASNYFTGAAWDGGVYIYYGSNSGIFGPTAGAATISGKPGSEEEFGNSVALGDINGDGYADLVVGADNYYNSSMNSGGVYIYSGSSSGIPSTTANTPTIDGKPAIGEGFGYSVSLSDITGDGYADLIIGVPAYNDGTGWVGGIYIYNGSDNPITSSTAGTPTITGKSGSGEYLGDALP